MKKCVFILYLIDVLDKMQVVIHNDSDMTSFAGDCGQCSMNDKS